MCFVCCRMVNLKDKVSSRLVMALMGCLETKAVSKEANVFRGRKQVILSKRLNTMLH